MSTVPVTVKMVMGELAVVHAVATVTSALVNAVVLKPRSSAGDTWTVLNYWYRTSNQQSADPTVLVGPVEELQTTMPVVNGRPQMPKSMEKFESAAT